MIFASGVPSDWKDYSFRLPAPGGFTVEMKVAGGKLAHLRVTPRDPSAPKPRVVLPVGIGSCSEVLDSFDNPKRESVP